MADKFDTLASIYQMMTPSDIGGVPITTTQHEADSTQSTSTIFRSIFNVPGGGLKSTGTIAADIRKLLSDASDIDKKRVQNAIRLYSTEGHLSDSDYTWHLLTPNPDDADEEPTQVSAGDEGMKEILSLDKLPTKTGKKFGIILSNENFVSPMTIGSRDAELFLNSIPTTVMSRCVPYLDVQFVFDRPGMTGKNQTLTAPGLLKFLLGAQDTAGNKKGVNFDDGTANRTMLEGNAIRSEASQESQKTDGKDSAKQAPYDQTLVGMELFTAPQTLTNPKQLPGGTRYVSVLDAMRPLASIESVNISVAPTYGLMSYKTAVLQLKVHDRSRLHELADIIKPLIYTRTTVWLTYGWRHPKEPNNPYANFINNTMLTREAYGIANSSYDFDHLGQATITLQLFTKGSRELKDIRITQGLGTYENVKKRIQLITEDIKRLRSELNLDKPSGILKEIRSFQILEAGTDGIDPNIDVKEVSKVLDELESSFLRSDTPIDKANADKLRSLLEQLYSPSGKGEDAKFAYKEQFEKVSKAAADRLMTKVRTGADPFLITVEKDAERLKQKIGHDQQHPFASVVNSYNSRTYRDKHNRKKSVPPRHLVSFGKLFSTFLSNGVATIEGIDELQIMFYPFNQRAGLAAGTNLAEFPIDMDVFLDQYRDHISRRRSDKITVEEFLKLVVDAQLQDVRGPGYGLFGFLEPYDPNTNDTKLKKGSEEEFEKALAQKHSRLGPFKMPVISVHIETAHVGRNGTSSTSSGFDLLDGFNRDTLLATGAKDKNFTKVLRVHVFDKAIDPYPTSSAILRGADGTGSPVPNTMKGTKKNSFANQGAAFLEQTVKRNPGLNDNLIMDDVMGVLVNDGTVNKRVKDFVSQTVPTIVYGSNASMIKDAKISTKQDANLTAVQMMANRAGRPSVTQPNGGGTMGLPLRIIPARVAITTLGCPVLRYAQIFFFDFNTGTTVDNKYVVTGLNHSIGPGKFETSLDMTWYDAYGSYEGEPTLANYLKLIGAPETD